MTYLMLLSARWSKSTGALDAALCSLGVFAVLRGGSARQTGKRRATVLSWLRTLARGIAAGRHSLSGNVRGPRQADLPHLKALAPVVSC